MTRAALVTGAGGDIGLAIARELGRGGHALTITSRRPERLEAAAAALRGDGYTVEAIAADVADAEALGALFAAHEARYGRLDVLVNNAGLGIPGEIDATPVRHLDLQLDVNLRAAVLGYHFGARCCVARGPSIAAPSWSTPRRSPRSARSRCWRSTRRRRRRSWASRAR